MGDSVQMESAQPDYRWDNQKMLLEFARKQLGVTDDDMNNATAVKAKIREFKIEDVVK